MGGKIRSIHIKKKPKTSTKMSGFSSHPEMNGTSSSYSFTFFYDTQSNLLLPANYPSVNAIPDRSTIHPTSSLQVGLQVRLEKCVLLGQPQNWEKIFDEIFCVLHTCNSKGESLSMFSHAFDFFRRM